MRESCSCLFYKIYESWAEIPWDTCILFNDKIQVAETAAFTTRLKFFFWCWKKRRINGYQNKFNFADIYLHFYN